MTAGLTTGVTGEAGEAGPGELTPAELDRAAATGSFWTAVNNVGSIPLAFGANALVARLLGPAGYGELAVVSLTLTIAMMVTSFGIGDAGTQWGAAAHARGDAGAVDALLQRSEGYRLLVQLPLMTATVLVVGRDLPGWARAMLVAAVALPVLMGSAVVCVSVENLTARNARLTLATNALVQVGIAATALLTPTALAVWAARTASSGALTPLTLLLLGPHRRRAVLRPRWPRAMPSGFWRYCAFAAATGIISLLVASRTEVLALGAFADPQSVGVYALAFGVAVQLRAPIDAHFAPFVPTMAGILAAHPRLAATTVQRALRLNGLLAGAVMIMVPPVAISLPLIYGAPYAGAVTLFLPLAAVATGQALVNPLLATAQARRQGRALVLTSGSALVVDVVVAVVGVQLCGVWGAVTATAAAQLTETLLLVRLQWRGGLLEPRATYEAALPYLAASAGVVGTGLTLLALTGDRPPLALAGGLWGAVLAGWLGVVRRTSARETVTAVHAYLAALPGPVRRAGQAAALLLLPAPDPAPDPEVRPMTTIVSPTIVSPTTSRDAAARAIAFYLPQFHPVDENDRWWGAGFTEWTNAARARPLYRGHAQPHLPADLGFYDLRLAESRQAQADLAARYGIEAFCYWHYWFGGGRRLLERPFAEVLAAGSPRLPFCLAWANQTWSGVWHGAPERILVEQTYPGAADDAAHFRLLEPAFHDARYLRVDGRPLFYVFRPEDLPQPAAFVDRWQRLAAASGLPGLYLVAEVSDLLGRGPRFDDPVAHGFDAGAYLRLPADTRAPQRVRMRLRRRLLHHPERYPYRGEVGLPPARLADTCHPTVYPNWDNTPRSGRGGLVLDGCHPDRFEACARAAVASLRDRPAEQRLLFVKSWNEWAEGNYLEPDLDHGHGYARALARALGVAAD